MNNFKSQFLDKYRDKYDYIEQILGAYTQNKIIEGFAYFEKELRNEVQKKTELVKTTEARMAQEIQNMSRLSSEERN